MTRRTVKERWFVSKYLEAVTEAGSDTNTVRHLLLLFVFLKLNELLKASLNGS